jgi:anti-sigma regulatory factor (Ser/Thr protein kinase)
VHEVCEVTPRAEIVLPASVHAPSIAREFLSEALCSLHGSAVLDDAKLLTSETITNAVLYGGPPIVLAVECSETTMEVRVRDGSPNMPRRRHPDEFAQHGRGMLLVDVLSDAWGVDTTEATGKEVWFRLSHDAVSDG